LIDCAKKIALEWMLYSWGCLHKKISYSKNKQSLQNNFYNFEISSEDKPLRSEILEIEWFFDNIFLAILIFSSALPLAWPIWIPSSLPFCSYFFRVLASIRSHLAHRNGTCEKRNTSLGSLVLRRFQRSVVFYTAVFSFKDLFVCNPNNFQH